MPTVTQLSRNGFLLQLQQLSKASLHNSQEVFLLSSEKFRTTFLQTTLCALPHVGSVYSVLSCWSPKCTLRCSQGCLQHSQFVPGPSLYQPFSFLQTPTFCTFTAFSFCCVEKQALCHSVSRSAGHPLPASVSALPGEEILVQFPSEGQS